MTIWETTTMSQNPKGGNKSNHKGGGNFGGGRETVLKFYSNSSHQAKNSLTYTEIRKRIADIIQRDFDYGSDIRDTILSEELVDFKKLVPPILESDDPDAAKKKKMDQKFEELHSDQMKAWSKRRDKYSQNLKKAWALVWTNHCSEVLKANIMNRGDYETTIDNNLLELFKAIKLECHSPRKAVWSPITLLRDLSNLFNIKQREGESILDYYQRFSEKKSIVMSHLGPKFELKHYVEQLKEFKDIGSAGKQNDFRDTYSELLMTGTFLMGSDRSRFGGMLKNLENQYSLGTNMYPTKLGDAVEAMNVHDSKRNTANNQTKKKFNNGGNKNDGNKAKNFAQKSNDKEQRRCFCCGSPDHVLPCPMMDEIPKKDWYRNTKKTWFNQVTNDNNQSGGNSTWSNSRGYSTFQQVNMLSTNEGASTDDGGDELRRKWTLDSGTTTTVVANEEMTEATRDAKVALEMTTNVGSRIIDKECKIAGFAPNGGWAKLDTRAMANVMSLSEMSDSYRITMDTSKENAFLVHTDTGVVKFKRDNQGLYTLYPDEQFFKDMKKKRDKASRSGDDAASGVEARSGKRGGSTSRTAGKAFVDTVEGNKKGFSARDIERADEARKFQHVMGSPPLRNLKYFIRQGLVDNCPVTTKDLDIAEKIYGPDVSTLKGRSTRSKPKPIVDDTIEVPPEILDNNQRLELCMDIMFINKMPFMTAIDRSLRYRSCVPLDSRTHRDCYKGLDKIIRPYNDAGFEIETIYCDGEFRAMMDAVKDEMGVSMDYCSPNNHVSEAERNNRVIKDRHRIAYHRLPFKYMPRAMIRELATKVTRDLNLFPAKGGVSAYYSPHMILQGRKLDYNKHCKHEFGTYVQADQRHEPTNDNRPRTIDAIYLQPEDNVQGGYRVMDLATGQQVHRSKVTPIPLTATAIRAVEEMAEEQGMTELKYTDRHGRPFPDADQSAGVVPDEEDIEEEMENFEDIEDAEVQGLLQDAEADLEDLLLNNDVRYDDMPDLVPDPDDDVELNQQMADLAEQHENDEDNNNHTNNQSSDGDGPNDGSGDVDIDHPLGLFDFDLTHPDESIHFMTDDESVPEESEPDEPEPAVEQAENTGLRRSTRVRREVSNWSPKFGGKTYAQALMGSKKPQTLDKRAMVKNTNNAKKKKMTAVAALTKLNKKKKVVFEKDKATKIEMNHNIVVESKDAADQYSVEEGKVIVSMIQDLRRMSMSQGSNFAQQLFLNKGLKKFGDKGKKAAMKELDQLHNRKCFEPISVNELTAQEKAKAQDALMFLTEKRDGTVKGRAVYNGKPTREWLSREDAASPTATTESIFLTATIDAQEGRDVMVMDVPNAFIQTELPKMSEDEDRVIMKITGAMVDMLVSVAPEIYSGYVVFENGKKVIYLVVLKAIYGMLQASLLWYKKFRSDLEAIDFKFNPYDPCVANRITDGNQHTVRFHVDDIMASHVRSKVNDDLLAWANKMYGSLGEVKASRGKVHDYLGMKFDFSTRGKVKVDMADYVAKMIDDFPEDLKPTDVAATPAGMNLFEVGDGEKLDKKKKEEFHTAVAKALFATKRARPDAHQVVAVLSTRVKEPTTNDWCKLVRLMKYFNGTRKEHLTLSASNLHVIKWYVDASFAVHPDFKSHTGGMMTMGSGAIHSTSKKQKLNTRSSTEAELVGADDLATMILWTKLFLEEQGYGIDKNILYQDNQSAMLLEVNGRKSAGKRSRAMNIRYYFLTDQVEKGNLQIMYCPTDEMIGDYFTKPLQGEKFRKFRKCILGN